MADRTTVTMVTFKHPFMLTSFDAPQPAGTYRMEVDEEEILGVSFRAFRRTGTILHLPAVSITDGPHRVVQVDFNELTGAIEADDRE